MADLIVTFAGGTATGQLRQDQSNFPKFIGSSARSERILIGASTTPGTLAASASETYVRIKAGVQCFVVVGLVPVAVDSTGWHLATGEAIELFVSEGESVACILGGTIL